MLAGRLDIEVVGIRQERNLMSYCAIQVRSHQFCNVLNKNTTDDLMTGVRRVSTHFVKFAFKYSKYIGTGEGVRSLIGDDVRRSWEKG